MIIAEDFQLDYGALIKALTGEHAAPAGAAAGGGGQAAPAVGGSPAPGQSQPRAGHKYVKRWWDGGKWQYEYPGEAGAGQHKGQMHYGDHDKREHQLELPEGHQFGPGQEKEAYQHALGEAMKPGTTHQVADPTGNGGQLIVSVKPRGKIEVSDGSGKAQKFDSVSAYEKWFRTVSLGPLRYTDHNGKALVEIVPNLGKPDEEGHLTPSSDRRGWVAKVAKDADPELAALLVQSEKRAGGDIGRFIDKAAAQKVIQQRLAFIEHEKGVKLGGGGGGAAAPQAAGAPAAPTQAEAPAMARVTATGAAPAPAVQPATSPAQQSAAAAPATPPDVNIDAMGREQWQRYQDKNQDPKKFDAALQQIGWRDVPDPETRKMKRQLNIDPAQKQKLVDQLAIQYTPLVRKQINDLAIRQGIDPARRAQFLEQVFGDVPMDTGAPFLPDEGTPIRARLEALLDNYDPEKSNYGFSAYAANSLKHDIHKLVNATHEENNARVSQLTSQDGGKQLDMAERGRTLDDTDPEHSDLESEAINVQDWQKKQESRIYQLARDKNLPKDITNKLIQYVRSTKDADGMDRFAGGMAQNGWRDYIWSKALQKASQILARELRKANASPFITRDKGVDPTHQYAHMEGDKDHPRYYFKDAVGNLIRYTNAPTGHGDASSRMGDAKVHPAEPTPDQAPQFFDPMGRKLTRAPYPGAQVEWNPSYHPHDPQNMWAGRWVNPLTGEHEHTYVDSDIRMVPKMFLHQTVALVDVRLPVLRKYYSTLSNSPMLKDKIVAVALALIDQGRFRAEELTTLTPADVVDRGALFKIGNRFIYADQKLRALLQLITQGRTGVEPLFAVPFVKKNGEVDPTLLRRVGPHFLKCTFDQIGISLEGLHVYHATQLFSQEVQRLVLEYKAPWESAVEYATVAVAQEMGHDLTQEPDMEQALPMIRELLIDPVVIDVLQRNAQKAGVLGEQAVMLPLPPPAIMFVSMDLKTRTADEEEFSRWLHGYPAHMVAGAENFVAPRRPEKPFGNKANMDDAQPPQPEADPSKPDMQQAGL